MWIILLQLFLLTAVDKFSNGASYIPLYCAYKDDTYSLNFNLSSLLRHDLLSVNGTQPQQPQPKLFIQDEYENCRTTQAQSSCFTMWAGVPNEKDPIIVKQGCWIKQSEQLACQTDHCSLAKSRTFGHFNSTVHFCCCHGNKCNEDKGTTEENPGQLPAVDNTQKINSKKVPIQRPSPNIPASSEAGNQQTGLSGQVARCSYKRPKYAEVSSNESVAQGRVLADGKTMMCDKDRSCFSFYTIEITNTSEIIHFQYQGCWVSEPSCNSSVCVSHQQSHYKTNFGENSNFCCCSGNFCNDNISNDGSAVRRTTTELTGPAFRHLHDPTYKKRTVLVSIFSVLSVAIIILTTYLLYRYCFHPPMPPANSSNNNLDLPHSPAFDIDNLKISCLINCGHFSEVWKGSLNEQDVAVKIYNGKNKQYYYNEKYIYTLPYMEHENILRFYGGEERILQDGNVQYLLVLQYIPDGTLNNYLKNNTMDWYIMCKMCQSLAKGMAHMHTDMGTGDKFKPTVAHRDLNSRNVLVKPDLSLIIADLGFCRTAMGSKLIHKGHTENAEQTSLTDVGTLRYMAPELLDGAVNLRDCEASLKQIDMYAFGLVMWEIATQCSDLYQGCPIPEYSLPYQAETGSPPSFEEMQLLVSRNKVRPKFPEVWKDYNQAIRALKETIEECWDHDAEARLTSMCVEERIVEMKMLWSHDSRNKGVTPTINTALLSQVPPCNRNIYHGNGHTYWGGLGSTSESSPNVVAEGSTSALIINDIHNNIPNVSHGPHVTHNETTGTSSLPPSWVGERRGSFSTSTMETTIAPTPVDPPPPPTHPKSQNINTQRNQPLPPHQGRNPITERNTHKRSDEELAVVGNNLLYGKDKRDADGIQSPIANSDIFDSLTDSLETSLMQNDILSQHRSPQIAYLQNQVHPHVNPGELPPKVVNNPLAQRVDNTQVVPQSQNIAHGTPKSKKVREMGFLGHLALLGKLAFGAKFDGKRGNHDNDNVQSGHVESGTVYDSIGQHNPIFEPSQSLDTEVRLTNGGPVVRPANLRVKQPIVANRELSHSNLDRDRRSEPRDQASGGGGDKAEKEPFLSSPEFSRLRGAPYSKSTSDLSPQKSCAQLRLEEEVKRPSTLSLKGHNYNKTKAPPSGSLNSLIKSGAAFAKGSDRAKVNGYNVLGKPQNTTAQSENPGEKIRLRNKTPVSEKQGRLSLYDDRLMSDSDQSEGDGTKMRKCSMSLQQFQSIDETTTSNVYTDCTC